MTNIKLLLTRIRKSALDQPRINHRIRLTRENPPTASPFMITSSGSSGTHLLGILLDSHSQIAVGPELYLLNKKDIYGDFAYFQQHFEHWLTTSLPTRGPGQAHRFIANEKEYGWDRALLPILAEDTSSLREFLDVFFGHFLRRRRKTIWGEKMPQNAYCIPEFLNTYPQGKIIHMVRDGRDVIASLHKRNISDPYAKEIWLYANAVALMWENDPRFLCVRYEDLVTQPEATLARIQEHIGVPVEEVMNQRKDNRYWHTILTSDQENIHGHWKFNPLYSPISASGVGSHQKTLDTETIDDFLSYTADQLQYPLPTGSFQSIAAIMAHLGYR